MVVTFYLNVNLSNIKMKHQVRYYVSPWIQLGRGKKLQTNQDTKVTKILKNTWCRILLCTPKVKS